MKTKKFITLLTLWGCLAFSTTFAAGYPEYLNDNPSYPLLYAHMDYATYLDADSVVLEYQSNLGTVWAQYEVGAGFHYDSATGNEILKSVEPPRVCWFYYPAEFDPYSEESLVTINGRDISLPPSRNETAYISYDSGEHWTAFNINDVTGVNCSKHAGFWKGLEIIKNKYPTI
ncbi:hypothetical protein [uncultured Megasphaera sp.]|jgi:hypothetical protein|uniref:hypothetical protein n=1 Tax=Megasphaera sp. TaxID=2023260 RepID=UPI002658F8CF|nr:hypothetical protein [uncultured Megasphaera sp.]